MPLVDDEGWFVPVVEVCELLVPWFIVEVEPMSVDDWFALTELLVLFVPLPTFTPGLMLAPAFTSELDTPTFAFTPTLGFTLSELLEGAVELLVEPVPLPDVPLVPEVLPVPEVPLPEAPVPLSEEELPEPERPLVPVPLVDPEVEPVPLREVPLEVVPPIEFVVPLEEVPPIELVVPLEVLPPMEPAVPLAVVLPVELVDPVVLPRLPVPLVEPVVPAVAESSMQSMCTGLFECSLALPVSLFASLPAFGWCRLLQSGLLVVAVVVVVPVVLPVVPAVVPIEPVVLPVEPVVLPVVPVVLFIEPLVPRDVLLPVALALPVADRDDEAEGGVLLEVLLLVVWA